MSDINAGPDRESTAALRRALWRSEVRGRLSSLRLSPARETEIVDELAQHLEDRFREQISGGASEEDATRTALAGFRHSSALAEQMRSRSATCGKTCAMRRVSSGNSPRLPLRRC
jgi:hypothetical protein